MVDHSGWFAHAFDLDTQHLEEEKQHCSLVFMLKSRGVGVPGSWES